MCGVKNVERKAHGAEMVLGAVVPSQLKEAWERGKTLFQEDLNQAKGKEYMEYCSMIEFAVDCYADVFTSRVYPGNTMLRDWASNGYMLAWRGHFLKGLDEEDSTEVGL